MKNLWIAVFLLGLGIIALAGPVLGAFPDTAHSLKPGFGAPVYAFEMARSSADLAAVFGPENDPLHNARLMQMDRGNRLDFAFMATYGLFMSIFFIAIWKESANPWWLLFAGVGLLSGCADAIENMILLNITSNLAQAPLVQWLGIPVWTKFLSIMACITAAGIYLTLQQSVFWKALGVASLLGGTTIFAAFLYPADYSYLLGTGTSLGWVAMLVFAGFCSFFNREK